MTFSNPFISPSSSGNCFVFRVNRGKARDRNYVKNRAGCVCVHVFERESETVLDPVPLFVWGTVSRQRDGVIDVTVDIESRGWLTNDCSVHLHGSGFGCAVKYTCVQT